MDTWTLWTAAAVVVAYLVGRFSNRAELKRNDQVVSKLMGEVGRLTTIAVISKIAERGGRPENTAAVRELGRSLVRQPDAPQEEEEIPVPLPQAVVVQSGMK